MAVTVEFMSAAVVKEFNALSDDLQRSFFYIVALMTERELAGVREPHVKSIGKGLYEIRMHAADGIPALSTWCARWIG